jgi:hypothetical protein
MPEISKDKEKFASIDIEDLKAEECHQKFALSTVGPINARSQDSMDNIKSREKTFLDSSQGVISLCIFDCILEGQKQLGTKLCGMEKISRRQLLLPR